MSTFISGNKIEKEPLLLFDKTDTSAVHHQPYWGLRKFGPYDKDRSEIKLAIICPKFKFSDVKKIIDDFNNGTTIMPGGMPKFFGCNIRIVKEIVLERIDISEYENKTKEFVDTSDPREIDVVFVYIPKTSRYFAATPYYRIKAILTSEGYVSQMITDTTLENLKWSYLNLASAIFSKTGSIPWVLESEMKNVDILLGVSISNIVSKKYRIGNKRRYVGYVNVFDNYGKWMFFEGTAQAYEKDKGVEQINELLTRALQKFQTHKGYRPKNITIHYYKKWGREERAAVIENFKNILGEFNVCFVSIDDTHPFRLYDMSVSDGSFPRGYFAYLGKNNFILSTTGHTEIAARRMGTPKLLQIWETQYPREFIEIDDIANQILSLTKLNWATATPLVREPVTLQFSREIAYLTAAVSEQEWKSISEPQVNTMLNKRPWFI